ncbi:hypothetical protein ZWY2020_001307 [Hordeum vulgare]|nr:hypothetical protein ZWY2020_001307 [Hordeum vulgare]
MESGKSLAEIRSPPTSERRNAAGELIYLAASCWIKKAEIIVEEYAAEREVPSAQHQIVGRIADDAARPAGHRLPPRGERQAPVREHCPGPCGPPSAEDYYHEQQLRVENARLKEELAGLTYKPLGRPFTQMPQRTPQMSACRTDGGQSEIKVYEAITAAMPGGCAMFEVVPSVDLQTETYQSALTTVLPCLKVLLPSVELQIKKLNNVCLLLIPQCKSRSGTWSGAKVEGPSGVVGKNKSIDIKKSYCGTKQRKKEKKLSGRKKQRK